MRPTRLLLPLLLLSLLLPVQAGSKPKAPVILRVAVQTSGEGLPETQAIGVALPPTGEMIQIRALPEATENNLIEVKADSAGYVQLIFDHQGKVNLSAVTGQNEGRILVVMINGVVVYSPIIDQQITNGELDIPHPLPLEIIKNLQTAAAANVKEKARR